MSHDPLTTLESSSLDMSDCNALGLADTTIIEIAQNALKV